MAKLAESQKEVIFRINREEYGISVTEVVSIEKAREIMPVPRQNPYVLGIINLRGSVVPIIDLRKVLTHAAIPITESTRFLMVMVDDQIIGFAVDEATDIVDVPASTIQKPAIFRSDFIYGIAKLDERMIVLLDIPSLMKNVVGDISV
jgi:purine-binding chemotaxis protein CheW